MWWKKGVEKNSFLLVGEKRSKEKRSKKDHHILETYEYRSISYRIRINHFIWASMPEEKIKIKLKIVSLINEKGKIMLVLDVLAN